MSEFAYSLEQWPPCNPRTGEVILIPDEHHSEECRDYKLRVYMETSSIDLVYIGSMYKTVEETDAETAVICKRLQEIHAEFKDFKCPECEENKKRQDAYYGINRREPSDSSLTLIEEKLKRSIELEKRAYDTNDVSDGDYLSGMVGALEFVVSLLKGEEMINE